MSVVYNEMLKKKSQLEMLEQQGKRKYEYDSDEDTEVKPNHHQMQTLCFLIVFEVIFREGLGSTKPGVSKWKKRY
jgi:hypothetical protein